MPSHMAGQNLVHLGSLTENSPGSMRYREISQSLAVQVGSLVRTPGLSAGEEHEFHQRCAEAVRDWQNASDDKSMEIIIIGNVAIQVLKSRKIDVDPAKAHLFRVASEKSIHMILGYDAPKSELSALDLLPGDRLTYGDARFILEVRDVVHSALQGRWVEFVDEMAMPIRLSLEEADRFIRDTQAILVDDALPQDLDWTTRLDDGFKRAPCISRPKGGRILVVHCRCGMPIDF
ncbi:hypothetical protein B0H17DRAFT_1334673 [Mycena rosella]|uniref:Uncharacterized protein n=1 Tax=Mycena rosella TaxID=1033263 RepID=A0AAD7D2A0_MYCRO|nr:hypothetical protein B0H17DRAFT_1334673 [Mycena rosella]